MAVSRSVMCGLVGSTQETDGSETHLGIIKFQWTRLVGEGGFAALVHEIANIDPSIAKVMFLTDQLLLVFPAKGSEWKLGHLLALIAEHFNHIFDGSTVLPASPSNRMCLSSPADPEPVIPPFILDVIRMVLA